MGLAEKVIEKLQEQLDPSRIKTREGPGGKKLSYLEGHDCVATANEIFGMGAWGYAVQEIQCVGFAKATYRDKDTDEAQEQQQAMYYAVVELHIADCAPITEAGFGVARGERAEHHEMAVKGAVTDGLKRCLKNYGEQFGLGLYGGEPRVMIPDDLGAMLCPGKKHQGKTLAEVYGEDPDFLGWIVNNWREDDVRQAVEQFLKEQETPEEEPAEMITLPKGNQVRADKKVTATWAKSLVSLAEKAGMHMTHLKNHLKKHYGVMSCADLNFKQAMQLREHLEGLEPQEPAEELVLDEKILEIAAQAGFEPEDAEIFVAEALGDDDLTKERYAAFLAYFSALASGTAKKVVDKVLDAALERFREE